MATEIEDRVLRIVREVFAFDQEQEILDLSLSRDLNATSLDQMTLFIALEEEFDRSITPDEVTQVDTIGDVVGFVMEKAKLQES